MSKFLRVSAVVGSCLAFVALGTGCSDPALSTPAPTQADVTVSLPTTVPTTAPDAVQGASEGAGHLTDPDPVARGRQVYLSAGCSACHGEDALGSDIAPGLPGHTELQIRRQSRGPIGIMPVFGPASLESDELDDLVAYVLSLKGEHMHGAGSNSSNAVESLSHHQMALLALDSNEISDAIHHVTHMLDLLEGPHLAAMQEALAAIESGDLHTGQHGIEAMLADVAVPAQSLPQLHLNLALSAIRVENASASAHHLDHATGLVSEHESDVIVQALDRIAKSDFGTAEQLVAAMLGVEAHGTEGDGHDDHDHGTAMEMHTEPEHESSVDPALMPLHLAYEAIHEGDLETAKHQIEEFIEEAPGITRIKAREALELLEAADLHEAEHAVGELLGIGAHND